MEYVIVHGPSELSYDEFRALNDTCFPGEPVGVVEFQEYTSVDHWIVAEDDVPVAFAVMTHGEQKTHIRRIGVLPSYRRKGIAQRLMQTMIKATLSVGLNRMDLVVQQDNPAAIELYEKHGFSVVGESVQFAMRLQGSPNGSCDAVPLPEFQPHATEPEALNVWRERVHQHDPPRSYLLVLTRDERPVGVTRFSPDFPGCSPFTLFDSEDHVRDLVSALKQYALSDKLDIKITTANPAAIDSFRRANVDENYSLYTMATELG